MSSVVLDEVESLSYPVESAYQSEAQEAPADAEPEYLVAATRRDREAAFRLVYQSYVRAGLQRPNRYRMRVTPYHLLPSTPMFIAKVRGEVVSTVSLVIDGDLGVPLELTFPEVIEQRRRDGILFGEVSCLADRRTDFRRYLPTFCQLTRLMAQYARRQGVQQLLVAAHPRHARFYRRYLGFEAISDVSTCPHVCDRPAVALCLDFDHAQATGNPKYDQFFGRALPAQSLRPQPLSLSEELYLADLIDASFEHAAGYEAHSRELLYAG
jgi:hypothetical protein